jgi:hypothetical protein
MEGAGQIDPADGVRHRRNKRKLWKADFRVTQEINPQVSDQNTTMPTKYSESMLQLSKEIKEERD